MTEVVKFEVITEVDKIRKVIRMTVPASMIDHPTVVRGRIDMGFVRNSVLVANDADYEVKS